MLGPRARHCFSEHQHFPAAHCSLGAQLWLSCVQVQGPVTTFEITNLPKGTEPRQLVDILDEGGFTDQFDVLLLGRENEDGHTTIINFRWAQVWVA